MAFPSLRYLQSRLELNIFYREFEHFKNRYGVYPAPSYVLWDATRHCNLKCLHCGASKESYNQELTTDQVMNFIDQLAELKVNFFAATGGEPLLRKDILKVMQYANNYGINTGIATNGYYLDHDKALQMRSAGIKSVQISIDGDEKTHNYIRQDSDSFRLALEAIDNCIAVNIPMVTACTVVSKHNQSILPNLLEILKQHHVKHWKIILTMPIGRATTNDCLISKEQFYQVMKFISKSKKRIDIQIGENFPFLGKYEILVRESCTFCPVGITSCSLGVDGKIRGCPEMPDTNEFIEGSILEHSFNYIWQKGFIKYRNQALNAYDHDCAKCNLWSKCRGGCWVMRIDNKHCIKKIM